MKPHITFPLTRSIFQPCAWPAMLCLACFLMVLYIYPKAPQELTIYAHHQKIYASHCPELSSVEPDYQHKKPLSAPFTLLNWNIYKQQRETWRQQLQYWSTRADLLTLQEVKYSPEFSQFNKNNHLFSLQNNAFQYKKLIYGVNTLSKYNSSFVCGTRYMEPWSRVPKTALASIYPLTSSAPLLVINFHGVNFTFTAAPLHKQIQPYLALIKAHHGPIIFAGDFNTWSEGRLTSLTSSLQQANLTEVPFHEDRRRRVFGRPLDHIYFRGLKVVKAESCSSDASDHNPQWVTFALK